MRREAGDRVALFMQNSPAFVVAYYAILRADAAVVPINPMNLTGELDYVLGDSGANVMLAAQELASQALPLLSSGRLNGLVVAAYSDSLTAPTTLSVPEFVRAPAKTFDEPGVHSFRAAIARGLEPTAHLAATWGVWTKRESTTEASIVAWAREQMAAYKVPRAVQFVDELPKSGSGKIQWRKLQEAEDQAARETAVSD